MNYRMIIFTQGYVMAIEAALLCVPMLVSALYGESIFPFLCTIGILLLMAIPILLSKPKNLTVYAKEGFVCVAMSWILLGLTGALPFVFSDAIPNYIDAFFETISGLTTTGASILEEVESLPKGILFWRSFTHWIGGMGILVFMIAILPSQDGHAIHLIRAETPGPTKGKLVPRMKTTALILYGIYLGISVLEVIALLIAGSPLYDAFVNTFATVGTGGFSVKNASIGAYNNHAIEWIIAIFMFLCGVNFNLYYFLLTKKIKDFFKNEELRWYFGITLSSIVLICINTFESSASLVDCIRNSFFQVETVMSTAGFSTVNFDTWPTLSKTILLILMFVGGSAGSTAGGLKVSRLMILSKSFKKYIRSIVHPNAVSSVRMEGELLSPDTMHRTNSYFVTYFGIMLFSLLLVAIDGKDLFGSLTAVISCINNVGPGFGFVGPNGNYSSFSMFSKIVLSLDMLFGRLELMPMLIFFSPSTWRKRI